MKTRWIGRELPLLLMAVAATSCRSECDPATSTACAAHTIQCTYLKDGGDCAEVDLTCISYDDVDRMLAENPLVKQPCQLALAMKALGLDNATEAKKALAGSIGGDFPLETYAYILASAKDAFDQLTPTLRLIFGSNASAKLKPVATDLADSLENISLRTILQDLKEIQKYGPLLNAAPDLAFEVPTLILRLDLTVVSGDLPNDLTLDLSGTWDRPELLLLTAGSGLLLVISEWIFAHNLTLDLSDLSISSTADVARILVNNPQFLLFRRPEAIPQRMAPYLVAAIGEIAGDPGRSLPSLLEAIDAEFVKDQSRRIVRFLDQDGDGQFGRGDLIQIDAVAQVAAQLGGIEPADGTFVNAIDHAGYAHALDFAQAVSANVVEPGTPVSLARFFSARAAGESGVWLWEAIQESVEPSPGDLRDWIHLDLGTYLGNPAPVRQWVPAVTVTHYVDPFAGDVSAYDFAIECELGFNSTVWRSPAEGTLPLNSPVRTICGPSASASDMFLKRIYFSDTSAPAAGDVTHFVGLAFGSLPSSGQATYAELVADTPEKLRDPVTAPMAFAAGLAPLNVAELPLLPDDKRPLLFSEAQTSIAAAFVPSILMRDPSFGGALYIDADGEGANPQLATNQSFNDLLVVLWQLIGPNIERFFD